MWLASLMSSGLLAEADDARLIKKFICDKGLLDSMTKDASGNRKEVEELCGTKQKKKKAVTTATTDGTGNDSNDKEKTSNAGGNQQ